MSDYKRHVMGEPEAPSDDIDRLLFAIHYELTWQEARARLDGYTAAPVAGSSPAGQVPPTKEQSHLRFYNAFHAWFMSEDSGCDFWSECDAPEALATIAVEIADKEHAAALDRLRNPSDEDVEQVAWSVCPITRAADECDMPQIMHGPRPECRKCPAKHPRGGEAGCRVVAELVARAALRAAVDVVERKG